MDAQLSQPTHAATIKALASTTDDSHPEQHYDFFLTSRRGSVAVVARENGYKVLVQNYDIPIGYGFIDVMHEAVKNSRDLVILFTRDYEQSHYTRREFTSFEAERRQSSEPRHIIILRREDVPLISRTTSIGF